MEKKPRIIMIESLGDSGAKDQTEGIAVNPAHGQQFWGQQFWGQQFWGQQFWGQQFWGQLTIL